MNSFEGENINDPEIITWQLLNELLSPWETEDAKAVRQAAFNLATKIAESGTGEDDLVKLRSQYQDLVPMQVDDKDTTIDPGLGVMLVSALILRKAGKESEFISAIEEMIDYADGMGLRDIGDKLVLLLS